MSNELRRDCAVCVVRVMIVALPNDQLETNRLNGQDWTRTCTDLSSDTLQPCSPASPLLCRAYSTENTIARL